jgi:hypothetical protein
MSMSYKYCPACKSKVRFIIFLLWLSKSNDELRCDSCEKTIFHSYVSWVSYISIVPMLYVSSYLVDKMGIINIVIELLLFLLVLVFGVIVILYMIFMLAPISKIKK